MNTDLERLRLLKRKGFSPQVIYDIGAYKGKWAASIAAVFPESQFFLFEANPIHAFDLKQQGFPYFIALLGDENKKSLFYAVNGTGDSILREKTSYYVGEHVEEKKLEMTTLSSLVKTEELPLPDLIKIDVQGAEILVLAGAKEVLSQAEAIVLETKILEYNEGAPLLAETMHYMDTLGYQPLDILEMHYLPSMELNEMDILFVKKSSHLIKTGILC